MMLTVHNDINRPAVYHLAPNELQTDLGTHFASLSR